MFCKKCGKKVDEADTFCPRCGTPTNDTVAPVQGPPMYYQNQYGGYAAPKVPGNGASIAGMVLGIIGLVYALITMMALMSPDFEVEILEYRGRVIPFAVGVILIQTTLSCTGLPLSISGMRKRTNGKNVSGLILNSITIVLSIAFFIYIVANYN